MKKKILETFILSTFPLLLFSQVKIGNSTPIASSAIMQIGNMQEDIISNTNKGFILPSVFGSKTNISTTTDENNGTLIYNVENQKVEYLKDKVWTELTSSGDNTRIFDAYNVANLSSLSTLAVAEYNNQLQGIVISDSNVTTPTTAKGALVLDILGTNNTNSKAFILPRIYQPHLNVPNPYPGFMCYDTEQGTLAIFNGSEWHYWK